MTLEEIKNIEPTVNIKLSEYNKILKYIETLDNAIGVTNNPYKNCLKDIIELIMKDNGAISRFGNSFYSLNANEIREIFIKHKLSIHFDQPSRQLLINEMQ